MEKVKIKPMDKAHSAPRCLARNRSGSLCQCPAIKDRKRCRLHGCAPGSGAPKGNRNAWKHGRYSAECLAQERLFRAVLAAATNEISRVPI